MRISSLLFLTFLLIFTGCKTVSYFTSPNDVFETNCILYLTNGVQDTGKITVQFETGHDVKSIIFFTKGTTKSKVPIESINYYEVNGNFYYPKIVDVELNGSENLLFVKRLTNENSRIQFFELTQKRTENSILTDVYNYFILFPDQDVQRPLNIASIKLTPNFDKKMSKLITDCPELSRKIETMTSGYYLPSYSLGHEKKRDVYLRIINEYNACK